MRQPPARMCAGISSSVPKLAPERADLHDDLAEVLRHEGLSTEAVEQYRQALVLDSADKAAHKGLQEFESR